MNGPFIALGAIVFVAAIIFGWVEDWLGYERTEYVIWALILSLLFSALVAFMFETFVAGEKPWARFRNWRLGTTQGHVILEETSDPHDDATEAAYCTCRHRRLRFKQRHRRDCPMYRYEQAAPAH